MGPKGSPERDMDVKRSLDQVQVIVRGPEVELLKLALRRATFEDTPPEQQQAILEFSWQLLRELGDSSVS